jgi:SAM-dependent methyltransferase
MSADEASNTEVTGYVDACDDGTLLGWASRGGDPAPVTIEVLSDGIPLGVATAGLYRADLQAAGIGDGRHGFAFIVPPATRSRGHYVLQARERETGFELVNSPLAVHENPALPFRAGGGQLRRFIAAQYCRGEGLEIGALHRPMPLPEGATARYIDSFSTAELVRLWSPEVDGHEVVPVDIVADATNLAGVPDASVDFIIASHVVEHLEDPVRCVFNLLRVIRPGGAALIVMPDRRHTFDANRPPTPVDHLVRDYCAGPLWSRRGHYEEWVTVVEHLHGEAARLRREKLEAEAYPIHFHVWQPSEFTHFLGEIQVLSPVPFEIDLAKVNPPEGIWVLRRV